MEDAPDNDTQEPERASYERPRIKETGSFERLVLGCQLLPGVCDLDDEDAGRSGL
jgi:hypothetical protein